MEMARRKPADKLRVEALPLDAKDLRETYHSDVTQNLARLERPPLSPREIEALRLIARGCTSAQIAQAMTVSEHTVRNFIRRIYLKMGVATRAEAVRLGLLQGLL
jgi:DNA-binding CsgD family transcriptional regulator